MSRTRPTDAEFEELKRQRDVASDELRRSICAEMGWDPDKVSMHTSHASDCYCACPEGPCQHIWDGKDYVSEDECLVSKTCSRCGAVAVFHDMRYAP